MGGRELAIVRGVPYLLTERVSRMLMIEKPKALGKAAAAKTSQYLELYLTLMHNIPSHNSTSSHPPRLLKMFECSPFTLQQWPPSPQRQ